MESRKRTSIGLVGVECVFNTEEIRDIITVENEVKHILQNHKSSEQKEYASDDMLRRVLAILHTISETIALDFPENSFRKTFELLKLQEEKKDARPAREADKEATSTSLSPEDDE